jgi:antirestriction protein ArdC
MPKNASTGRFYSGINVLILWGSVIVAETIPMAPAAQKITLSSSRDIPFCPNRTSGA